MEIYQNKTNFNRCSCNLNIKIIYVDLDSLQVEFNLTDNESIDKVMRYKNSEFNED
jgi:hypothetical protein